MLGARFQARPAAKCRVRPSRVPSRVPQPATVIGRHGEAVAGRAVFDRYRTGPAVRAIRDAARAITIEPPWEAERTRGAGPGSTAAQPDPAGQGAPVRKGFLMYIHGVESPLI